MMFANKLKGAETHITPEQYRSLDDRGRYNYVPDYKKWKVKKVRNYSTCDCCGHREFLGLVESKVGVGDPHRYTWRQNFVPYELQQEVKDRLNNSNVLTQRIIGKW